MNNYLPKVSVITPTYNRPHLIGRAIRSILNQTYQNFEIIVIDDNLNDETKEIVNNFRNKRIKHIRNPNRKGSSVARNQGVRESNPNSKYVAFLDDDDEWLPQFLEKTIGKLEEKKELTGVLPNAQYVLDNGTKVEKNLEEKKCWNTTIGNGAVLRKSLFTKENIWYDETIIRDEDIDFGIRVFKNHKIEFIPEELWIYHAGPIGSTLSTNPMPIESINHLFKKHLSYFSIQGNKPLSYFYHYIGKLYSRSGEIKKGKKLFLMAFLKYPHPVYILYYLFWSFPKFAQNFHSQSLKQKVYKFYGKFKNKFNQN